MEMWEQYRDHDDFAYCFSVTIQGTFARQRIFAGQRANNVSVDIYLPDSMNITCLWPAGIVFTVETLNIYIFRITGRLGNLAYFVSKKLRS